MDLAIINTNEVKKDRIEMFIKVEVNNIKRLDHLPSRQQIQVTNITSIQIIPLTALLNRHPKLLNH